MAARPSRGEVLSLFRSLLRTARGFSDYNIREYTKRRTVDAFRHNKDISDPLSICAAFADGKSQLEVAKRQAVVYSLYVPKLKSVMELNHSALPEKLPQILSETLGTKKPMKEGKI